MPIDCSIFQYSIWMTHWMCSRYSESVQWYSPLTTSKKWLTLVVPSSKHLKDLIYSNWINIHISFIGNSSLNDKPVCCRVSTYEVSSQKYLYLNSVLIIVSAITVNLIKEHIYKQSSPDFNKLCGIKRDIYACGILMKMGPIIIFNSSYYATTEPETESLWNCLCEPQYSNFIGFILFCHQIGN